MKPRSLISISFCIFLISALTAGAGDRYWSSVDNLTAVRDFAVCGNTVYASSDNGLFRNTTQADVWQQLRTAPSSLVACDGSRVFWHEVAPDYSDVLYISHDGLQTATLSAGLVNPDPEDLAISGNIALVATINGVDRSTDGGLSFPGAYPVLWDSGGGYHIEAVWTNGSDCVAAGTGGSLASGIWYSAGGDAGTWTRVEDVLGQNWLSGNGGDVLVSGARWSGYTGDEALISEDGGATWTALPSPYWGDVEAHYQRPFASGQRIFSRYVYEWYDPGSGLFVTESSGPFFYDADSVTGNDLGAGYYPDGVPLAVAIVEAAEPILLVAEQDGALWWYRVSGGWPAGFDFTPPYRASIDVSPRLMTTAGPAPVDLSLEAYDNAYGGSPSADQVYLLEQVFTLNVWFSAWSFYGEWESSFVAETAGWRLFTTSSQWDLHQAHGAHLIHAWYTDAAGNMTDPSVFAGVTTLPATLQLADAGVHGAYIWADAGETFTVTTAGAGGDIDIYHWEPPGGGYADNIANTYSHDSLTFTTANTGFHTLYLWNYVGSGAFDGTVSLGRSSATVPTGSGRGNNQALSMTVAPELSDVSYVDSLGIFRDGFESGNTEAWSAVVGGF